MPDDVTDVLLTLVRRWENERDIVPSCPACGAAGLLVEDQSTRPIALWYHVACQGCGLAETMHIPVGAVSD